MIARIQWPATPLWLWIGLAIRVSGGAEPDRHLADYTTTIRPLLAERCFSCHGSLRQEAGLRLDTVALMLAGGESGPAVRKGDALGSLLLRRIGDPDVAVRMPPDGEGEPLAKDQIALLGDWIEAGSPAPADEEPEADPRSHWAFQPLRRPVVPMPPHASDTRNAIDAFLAATRGTHGISPQPEAPRHVLVRRLFIDLVGLPPQPDEFAACMADPTADWYERLVDRLLADPRHGERWARHWMDVWRYSEAWGLGNEHRKSQKHMWHFRDWIVESLNADTGYDEMLRQMLAADELYPNDPGTVRATGFLARNYFVFNRTLWLDETVEHVGKGFLGLTLNCAKCHAHKYDPIGQEDYYRFRGFFEPIETRLDVVPDESDLDKDGIPRVFDGHPDRPTHLFVRGEDTKPDRSRTILPGVPQVLAFHAIEIEPVALPHEAFEPQRQPWVLDAHAATAARAVARAEAAVADAARKMVAADRVVADAARPDAMTTPAATAAGFSEDFATLDAGRWQLLGGRWKHEPGRLSQDADAVGWAAARLVPPPPRDFEASIRFTIRGGGWRSVGIGFDSTAVDPVARQEDGTVLVYASGYAAGSKVQAAYARGGSWVYPAEAASSRDVAGDRPYTLRIAVRDRLVNVWFDDELAIAWRTPLPRRDGSLQIVTFDATATIDHVSLAPLRPGVDLREPAAPIAASPSVEAAVAARNASSHALLLAEAALAVEKARATAVLRRGEAMRASWDAESHTDTGSIDRVRAAARAAVRAERETSVAEARRKILELEAKASAAPEAKRAGVQKEIASARAAEEKAVAAAAEPGEAYTPLPGARWTATRFKESRTDDAPVAFPPTSTGRRTALARWITDPRHPLTARVAVNQIWMRHIGKPLVGTVFDFGRKGTAPTHPELLDWLASELIDGAPGGHGWSMKHLHRLICTSAAYRMGSSTAGADAARRSDPDNRWLWRREPMRLEAQVVRDAILALSRTLDETMGGPSVPAEQQAASRRRSLYFWHSETSRNPFLVTFDDAAVKECYQREASVVPQQALALSNATLVHDAAATIAARVQAEAGDDCADDAFLGAAFRMVLHRGPTADERAACEAALAEWRSLAAPAAAAVDPARIHVVWALLNHNDFVTLR